VVVTVLDTQPAAGLIAMLEDQLGDVFTDESRQLGKSFSAPSLKI